MSPWTWLAACALMVALDLSWARYTRATTAGHRTTAGLWAIALHILGTMVTLAAVHDWRYLSATAIGAFVGTFLGTERKTNDNVIKFYSTTIGALDRKYQDMIVLVANELHRARVELGFGPMHSAHEGFAIMAEEFDELKAHVWMKQSKRDLVAMREEAIQVAAMALAFAAECCDGTVGRR